MKIETGQLAGQLGWYVFVDGKLDCDIPAAPTEAQAATYAQCEYPGRAVLTTSDPEHYSNQ